MTSMSPSSDPREWRPLKARPTRRAPEIRDPIIEPLWDGLRVLAHFRARSDGAPGGHLELLDADGHDVTRRYADATAELSQAVIAFEAVIDGILTGQATASDVGAAIVPQARASAVGMMLSQAPQLTVEALPGPPADTPIAFVALDLLSIDDQPLLDLPLLERKRQLEGLLTQGELVRVSSFVRPPVAPWLNSWKSAGFRGVMLKAANSRYQPGQETAEWAVVLATAQR